MKKLNFTYIATRLENEEINTIYKKYCDFYAKRLTTKREIEFMFQKEMMDQFPNIAFDVCTNIDF